MAQVIVDFFKAVHVQDQQRLHRARHAQGFFDQLPGVIFVVQPGEGVTLGFLLQLFGTAVLGVRIPEKDHHILRPFFFKVDD